MRKISLIVLFCFMFTCLGLTGCGTTDTGDKDNIGQELESEVVIQDEEIKPENMIIDNSQLADKKIKLFVVDFINYLKDFERVKELQSEDRFADLDNILISGGSIVIEGSLEEEVVKVNSEVSETSDVINVEVVDTPDSADTTNTDDTVVSTETVNTPETTEKSGEIKEDVNPGNAVVDQVAVSEENNTTEKVAETTVETATETASESVTENVTENTTENADSDSEKSEEDSAVVSPEDTDATEEIGVTEETEVKKETIQLAPFEDFFHYPSGSLITQEDIEYIIPRMGVDMLPTYTFDEIYIDSVKMHQKNEKYEIVIKDSLNGEYKFNIVLGADGNYRVDISDYFIREVSLKLATMENIVVDGVEISIPERNNLTQNTIFYFPAMTARVHKVDFNNTAFGPASCEFVIDKSSYNTVTEVNYELSAEETTGYLPTVKTLATNVITAMIKSQTVDSLKPYFVDGYNTEMLSLYSEGAEFRYGVIGVPTITKVDFVKNTKSVLVGDNSIKIMFKYQISYIQENNKTPKTTSDVAFMTINTTDGETWKIEDIESSFLTNKFDSKINNWDKY